MTYEYVTPTPTPITDRLNDICGGLALSSLGKAGSGGEWDSLRQVSPRVRRRLQGAGWIASHGDPPDMFANMLRQYAGSQCEPDPIAWYCREAVRAVDETQAAGRKDRLRRLARKHGFDTYYQYRAAWCAERGHRSVWAYRQQRGWV